MCVCDVCMCVCDVCACVCVYVMCVCVFVYVMCVMHVMYVMYGRMVGGYVWMYVSSDLRFCIYAFVGC